MFRVVLTSVVLLATSMFSMNASAVAATTERFVSFEGNGDRSGSDSGNAAPITDLTAVVQAAGPGGTVTLADGEYRLLNAITVSAGGLAGSPVTIRGQGDGTRIIGKRSNPYVRGSRDGSPAIRLKTGADHIRFTGMAFENMGNGAFVLNNDLTDVTIDNMRATNVRRFLENEANVGQTATVTGLWVHDVRVDGFSKGAVRLRYATNSVVMENVVGDSQRQDRDFSVGVALQGTVSNVLLRNVSMRNSQDTTTKYWNGDGFATESGVTNIVFENTTATGNADAGYDIKSRTTSLKNVLSGDNKRNFRMWAPDSVITGCTSETPRKRGGSGTSAHVYAAADSHLTINGCHFHGGPATSPAFDLEKLATVDATAITSEGVAQMLRRQPGAKLTIDGTRVSAPASN